VNDQATVPAPATRTSAPPRCDMELASFELYVAAVLAESNRLFAARGAK
jgi:hypothetical protein